MKKSKFFSLLTSGIIISSIIISPVYALDWTDGVQSGHVYTYEGVTSDEGLNVDEEFTVGEGFNVDEEFTVNESPIRRIHVKDKNNTIDQDVLPGDSVTSRTGTITWKDSYENVTVFYLDVKEGYDVSVYVDGKEGEVYDLSEEGLQVKVNSDLGKDRTYGIEALPDYNKVIYFSSAGSEAWSKGHKFELKVERKMYPIKVEKYSTDKVSDNQTVSGLIHSKYGDIITKETLGLAPNEYIVGGSKVITGSDPIQIVTRSEENDFKNYQYGFTYVTEDNNGFADSNIEYVNAYWNNNYNTKTRVQLNETVRLNTGANLGEYNIKFEVKVKDGYTLTGKKSSGDALNSKLVDAENNIYEIEFTRVAHHGMYPVPINETFTLETEKK